ncbi:MAG: alanine racemase [Chromatiales bacterium]|jgi:alanine racemase|nr:alanine racemase [Chromatiales bacterium]
MTMLRPAWMEVDLAAISYNVSLVRKRIGPDVRLFAVVKSHGFGCGPAQAARAALAGGADSLAVGDPGDAQEIREAGIDAPVLLYASTPPDVAAEVAALNVIVTIHDMESLRAFANQDTPVDAFMKAEVGLGRLGVLEEDWQTVFDTARASNSLSLTGIYTHLNAPDDPEWIKNQVVVYERACSAAQARGFENLTRMVASSHVVLGYEALRFNAVNPGRFLFGLVEGKWAEIDIARPVMSSIKSRVIQTKEFAAGDVVGFLGPKPLSRPTRLAVLPIGFGDGFNHLAPLGELLVEGQRVPIIGRRGIEHTVIDVTKVRAVKVGSEAVLLGSQGNESIAPDELAGWLGLPVLELLPRLARTLPKVYLE